MHDELKTFDAAVARLMHDTLVHLVRKPGQLRMVRVSVPSDWDADAFTAALIAAYAERGWHDVVVHALPTEAEPRLLSVVT